MRKWTRSADCCLYPQPRARDELYVIGDVIAYGKKGTAKERDTRVENELLVDSLKFAGKTVPPEPEKEKKYQSSIT